MRIKLTILALLTCVLGVGVCYAQSPFIGTWTLNEAKSKIAPGAGKITKVIFEEHGQDVTEIREGTDAKGEPVHDEWTGKFDGRYYPVKGTSKVMVAITKINSRTLALKAKEGTKVVATARMIVSPDGKTRTVIAHSTNAVGKPERSVWVYDKA
jgi:hypothetical protein